MKVSKIILLLFAFTAGIAGAFFYENLAPAEAKTDKAQDIDDPKGLHPYFSPGYNKPYPISRVEYRVLLLTADLNCEEIITTKLMKISLRCYLLTSGLEVVVDTKCLPEWSKYRGKGEWAVSDKELCAAYTEAAKEVLVMVRKPYYFPKGESGLTDDEITVEFLIQGAPVGEWRNGEFALGMRKEVKSLLPSLDKILDDMKFENAPTLRPIAMKYLVAIFKGEWEKVWDMMSNEMHKMLEHTWMNHKTIPIETEMATLAKESNSAKEFFVKISEKQQKSEEDMIKELKEEENRFEVVGEEFSDDGKTGWIKTRNLKTGKEEKLFKFVKEDGKWKIDSGG